MTARRAGLCAVGVLAATLSASGQGVPSRRAAFVADPLGPAAPAVAANAPVVLPLHPSARSVRVRRAGEVIRTRPHGASPRRGTAALDALLPVHESALGPGCASRWVRVGSDAWMCQDDVEVTALEPAAAIEPRVPAGDVVPYLYGFASYAGVQTYRSLEDVGADAWAEQLERGMGVALDARATLDGATYVRTVGNRWIAARDLSWARPSTRAGVRYDPGDALGSAGFALRRAYAYDTAEDAANPRRRGVRPRGFVVERAPVRVREEQTVRGRRVVRTDEGWLQGDALRVPEAVTAPENVGPDERWIDVDTRRQLVVAYEGARPVYLALASTGRAGHATTPGTFRAWVKLATSTMSNADDPNLDTSTAVYSVEHVPWVLYFNRDQALHGVYWHDRFGTARSHGCVNLAPRDARWIFDWAPPAMPAGWNAVFPTQREPGVLVRVR